MINNDEWVVYGPFPASHRVTRVTLERPIFEEENLNTAFRGHRFDEKPPEERLTLALDTFFRFKAYFEAFGGTNGLFRTISKAIANYIAGHYYSPMSGGMAISDTGFLLALMQHANIDMTTGVYPDGDDDKWLTLTDFVTELKKRSKHQEWVQLFNKLFEGIKQGRLPAVCFPLLSAKEEEKEE
jgi:hypothetical protein